MRVAFVWCILLMSLNGFATSVAYSSNMPQKLSDVIKPFLLKKETAPVSMSFFSLPVQPQKVDLKLQGKFELLSVEEYANLALTEQNETYNFEKRTRPNAFTNYRKLMPKIVFNFTQYENKIIPHNRGLQLTEHPHWDYFIGVGDIWQEKNESSYRISLPFTLIEKNQNCAHNGVLSFAIDTLGETSNYYYQVSSETCLYYKVDMWGLGTVSSYKESTTFNENVVNDYKQELAKRDAHSTIDSLLDKYANLDKDKLELTSLVNGTDITSYSVVINGENFRSECQTRSGPYPYCDQLILPSYSTAKSIFSGIGMMSLVKKFPTIMSEQVSDWVAECNASQWKGVTFGNLLNMTTGNYLSKSHSADEMAEHSQSFFKAKSHQSKLDYSCNTFPRKSVPGSIFVYHSADTYLLGVVLSNFVANELRVPASKFSLFDYLFVNDLWPRIGMSKVANSTRVTSNGREQPFFGYGLFFTNGDMAKITRFLYRELKTKSTLDNPMLTQVLERKTVPNELETQYSFIHYINGFWKQNVTQLLGCEKETWLPYMLGYGGIYIVLVSEDVQYFYFSDSGQFIFRDAIQELAKIMPICRS